MGRKRPANGLLGVRVDEINAAKEEARGGWADLIFSSKTAWVLFSYSDWVWLSNALRYCH